MTFLECSKIINESLDSSSISLQPFNENLFNKLVTKTDQQRSHVAFRFKNYDNAYTIYKLDEVAGFISYIPSTLDKDVAFVQIVILKPFRGQGILPIAYNILTKQNNIKRLLATIRKDNTASIKAHVKIGFKFFPEKKLEQWRKIGRLDSFMTRLYKDYK